MITVFEMAGHVILGIIFTCTLVYQIFYEQRYFNPKLVFCMLGDEDKVRAFGTSLAVEASGPTTIGS